MQKLISLWKNQSKTGNIYYSGKLGELNIIGFENGNKTNEKQPDLTLYVADERKKEEKQEMVNDPFQDFGDLVEVDDNFLN